MIYEYAIQPEVLVEWADTPRDYSEFLREYGLGTPRIFSIFPKQKIGKLRSYLLKLGPQDKDSSHAQRYTEMVLKIIECIVHREILNNDIEHEKWKDLVFLEDKVNKIDVIISNESINSERNLTPSNMHDIGSIWQHKRQRSISRTNQSLYEALQNMLRLASDKIVVIDPYSYADDSIKFVSFMLNKLNEIVSNEITPLIYILFKEARDSATPEYVKRKILENLNFYFDEDNLKVKKLEKEEVLGGFHNRYFLTEHACVSLGHGFTLSGNSSDKDEITLYEKELYNDIENRFMMYF